MTEDRDTLIAAVIEQLEARRSDALTTLDLLRGYRERVAIESSQLENPQAVLEYIDFFNTFVERAVSECGRISAGLADGATRADVDTLRQLASNSAAEQRRCLIFRDKWINKPLAYERMRPLLNDISVATRDQLTAFRDLNNAATTLAELTAAPADQSDAKKNFDRRALFTRLFKP